MHRRLLAALGPQHWWPASSPFEVVVGAILTQRVAWTNVVSAIGNLARRGWLEPRALAEAPRPDLESAIRPAGFYRQKAARLQAVAAAVASAGGDVSLWLDGDLALVRDRLLATPGIGPETADSILCYAGGRPVMVVDAYARRIFARLGEPAAVRPYAEFQEILAQDLPAAVLGEFHALLVSLGKQTCRAASPRCGNCPLQDVCQFASQLAGTADIVSKPDAASRQRQTRQKAGAQNHGSKAAGP